MLVDAASRDRLDTGQPSCNLRIVDTRRGFSRCSKLFVLRKRVQDFMWTFDRLCEKSDFVQLLFSKGHPTSDFLVELYLSIEVDGRMKERAGWRNIDAVLPQNPDSLLQRDQRAMKIGAPDVASIDDAER